MQFREKCIEKGAKTKSLEIAKKMLKDKMNISIIIKYTNPIKEEIENL